ncbi:MULTISPECIES: MotA/TolQ/ExbB proton channel family protein [Rhodomicrobium]|uniref:MotA/TolQ/ExbB proton channel family protein n=1 Tax=Rhodomicrobium TaxID=1068 RepID=UPI001AEC73F7|nr:MULTISPECIES: MotA/TolQ/ExbB proton channel family protein [Rhodomicrobium]
MTKAPYYKTLSTPQTFVWRMFLFVALASCVGVILYAQILTAFKANPALNGVIMGTLGFGVIYTFQQVLRLYPEIRWVNNFRIADPGLALDRSPVMLAPMATLLRRRQGQAALSATAMRSILDSIAARLDESRETTRYMIGLLVFLGLLGTFWGLMETVQSVGGTIAALSPSGGEGGAMFEELKTGLAAPLAGMGVAFSSSLFGLAGSLIVGFLDLQAGQAQARFYNELEEWLSNITELSPEGSNAATNAGQPAQLRFALLDMQRTMTDLADKIEQGMARNNGTEAMLELSRGIDRLVKQMRAEQKVVREWVDEQAHQQNALANVLREQNKLATILRDVAVRPPRGGGDR